MDKANQTWRERRASKTRKALVDAVKAVGIRVSAQTPLRDEEDQVGLVGEIVVENVSTSRNYQILWPKWEVGGTSKSPGIDLLVKAPGRVGLELRLVESKHLHEEVKGTSQTACVASIKGRFKDGIEEFDSNKTLLNIAGVVRQMSATIRTAGAMGSNVAALEQSRDFVRNSLSRDEYTAEVVACIDSKYCSDTTLSTSTHQLQRPSSVGSHSVELAVLACESLEGLTDQI
jgi:hypothetical protein